MSGFLEQALSLKHTAWMRQWETRLIPQCTAREPGLTSPVGPAARFADRKFEPVEASMLGTILLIVLILLLLGAIPAWPYSRGWGYFPSGGLGLVLIVVVILLATGRI